MWSGTHSLLGGLSSVESASRGCAPEVCDGFEYGGQYWCYGGLTYSMNVTVYGASKAALNLLTKNIHMENEGLIAFSIHPRYVLSILFLLVLL
jgi:NAD(P)-dependent dehydrogenase (short-subunit alcohol dehydrogenase family)